MAHVIVIEDDESIRRLLQQMLEHAGHHVTTVGNGDECIELFHRERPDRVITDILMPVKEGIGTIYELRRAFPDVKIIAMSAGGSYGTPSHYVERTGRIGAQLIFTKSFETKVLLESVGELLADSRSSGEEHAPITGGASAPVPSSKACFG
jgi:DNA-binding NtrC family response regulator